MTLDEFWSHFAPTTGGCWEWTGARHTKGYGLVRWNGRMQRVHRLVWNLTKGEVPPGLLVCHRCDNPPCGNPDHLFLATASQNLQDMAQKGRATYHRAKLTQAEVAAIRTATGTRPEIARTFGISTRHVYRIRNRAVWRVVPLH